MPPFEYFEALADSPAEAEEDASEHWAALEEQRVMSKYGV